MPPWSRAFEQYLTNLDRRARDRRLRGQPSPILSGYSSDDLWDALVARFNQERAAERAGQGGAAIPMAQIQADYAEVWAGDGEGMNDASTT